MQWVKDPVLSLQQLRSVLWRGFDPWPQNFSMTLEQPKKKKWSSVTEARLKNGTAGREISQEGCFNGPARKRWVWTEVVGVGSEAVWR